MRLWSQQFLANRDPKMCPYFLENHVSLSQQPDICGQLIGEYPGAISPLLKSVGDSTLASSRTSRVDTDRM